MATNLFVNTAATSLSSAFVRSVSDMTPVDLPQFVLGDNPSFDLYFCDGLGNYAPWSGDSSYTPNIAIGSFAFPTGGTFTISFGGYTTSALAFNASLAVVQSAFQALTSVGAGNALITGVPGEYYVITFAGSMAGTAETAVTVNFSGLTPASTITVAITTAGGAGVNCVQLLALQQAPISFANTWTTITNGWTGKLSMATLAMIQAFDAAAQSVINETFQITVFDSLSNSVTYAAAACTVNYSLINPSSYAGTNYPALATVAALSAAVLGLNNFTSSADTSSATGNTNISPPSSSRLHTSILTVTGAAGTRTLSILTSQSPAAGALVQLSITTPATAAIVLQVRNATSGGTLLDTITTDGTGTPHVVWVEFNGTAWQLAFESGHLLAAVGNLAGLASTLTSKANLATLFSSITALSGNQTLTAANEGQLVSLSASGGAATVTLPSSGIGAGWMCAIQKSDGSAYTIITSPATYQLQLQGDTIILLYDGAAWNVVIYCNALAAGGFLSVQASSSIRCLGTGGIGYGGGAGSTVTQTTNRTTGVTINKTCGQITTSSASLAVAAVATFTVTDSTVAAVDVPHLAIASGAVNADTIAYVSAVAAGSFNISVKNLNAATAETGAIVINFAIVKGSAT
jgi:hypothetical protein